MAFFSTGTVAMRPSRGSRYSRPYETPIPFGTCAIRCTVDNADGVLKPGMFVTAELPQDSVTAITVPEGAVQDTADGVVVFVARDGGRFERRSVVLGLRTDGQVAVTKGLIAGDVIVVQGAFWVRTQLEKATLEE